MPDPHTHLPADQQEWPSLDPADRPLVITHAACPDGWCCEFLFRRHFGANADYMQAKYGDPIPDVKIRPWVYIADFSWKRDDMIRLIQDVRGRVTVLEHHRTAEGELTAAVAGLYWDTMVSAPKVLFDLNRSGAMLTWQYLKDAGATDPVFATDEPPAIVQYVQDRDLWKWELPYSKEINAALASYAKTVEVWGDLWRMMQPAAMSFLTLVAEGEAILRQQEREVQAAVARAVEMDIAGHRVLVVNTTCHHSEIGERLSAGRPFGATYYDDLKRGLRCWSFRSREGGIDVSEIARRWPGGGGHRQAAGCQQPLHHPVIGMSGIPAYNQETQITLAT